MDYQKLKINFKKLYIATKIDLGSSRQFKLEYWTLTILIPVGIQLEVVFDSILSLSSYE